MGRKIDTTRTHTHHVEIIVIVGIEGLWWIVCVIHIYLEPPHVLRKLDGGGEVDGGFEGLLCVCVYVWMCGWT